MRCHSRRTCSTRSYTRPTRNTRSPSWQAHDTTPPPTKGMTVEGQVRSRVHAAAPRLNNRDMVSIGEPTIAWTTGDLVEDEAAPEEECMDPAAARKLFLATRAS